VFREFIEQNGGVANIPRKTSRKKGNAHMDWCLYKYRHLVENVFLKIKKYRAVATRYDKLERIYNSIVSLAFVMIWLPMYG
jgi:transposase